MSGPRKSAIKKRLASHNGRSLRAQRPYLTNLAPAPAKNAENTSTNEKPSPPAEEDAILTWGKEKGNLSDSTIAKLA
jgi:hypothetical protein